MKTGIVAFLLIAASTAHAQDFKRGAVLTFEYPAVRTVSAGRARCYSSPAHQPEMLAVLAAATRLSFYPTLSFAVAVEAETTIERVSYRLFFPRIPPQEAPCVFAAAPATAPQARVYFELPREQYVEFARRFRDFINVHDLDAPQ